MKYTDELTKSIKQKPELKSINPGFIKPQLETYIQKHPKILKKIQQSESYKRFQLSKEYKQILKTIRASIRKSYGMFQLNIKKRTKLLEKLKQDPTSLPIHDELLKTHRSTKERLRLYPKLYKDIFKITNPPVSILDLGCGLNPISLPYMKLKNPTYIASELNKQDTDLLKQYFRITETTNKTPQIDLIKDYKKLSKYKTDITFLFKLLDSLEVTKKGVSELMLKNIKSKYIVVSFSTRTIGNKPMRNIRRKWFEYLTTELNKQFQILKYENEIFYILS